MRARSLALCLVAASALVSAAPGQAPPPARAPRTYCNPLPIPDYPVGRLVRDLRAGDKTDGSFLWFVDRVEQYPGAGGPHSPLARRAVVPLSVRRHGLGQR